MSIFQKFLQATGLKSKAPKKRLKMSPLKLPRTHGGERYEIVWCESSTVPCGPLYTEAKLRDVLQKAAHTLVEERRHERYPPSYYKTQIRRISDGAEIKVYVKPKDGRRVDWLSDVTSGERFP
jgi:hypothetical protein